MTVPYEQLHGVEDIPETRDESTDRIEEAATALATARYEDAQGTTSIYPRFTDC
ncbi:hypothetical protein RIF23_02180 [Lipingzhangella sp. LS1_29]|uniref:Uncharacterized protein n=1 Tax=Lipingzhangella rawalii TaxID=2055835 RepID=A0ABU2H1C7_9ACTN|nr:hypothetical protein [Lipingzhangella rawalii]MDS1269099.1 hypothetical protein [Lipingzhangella rawalii]